MLTQPDDLPSGPATPGEAARTRGAAAPPHPAAPARLASRGDRLLADLIPLLLTVAAGATDALAYLGLGGVFTANMTGNLVLFGIAGAHGVDLSVARASAATLAFAAGLVLTFRLTRHLPTGGLWPRRITGTLAVSLLCQLAFLAGWIAVDARPARVWDVVLVAVSALAMGIQTACARRVAVAGITTTFVTGTLTAMAESAASGSARHLVRRLCVLLALVLGALGGAFALSRQPTAAAAIAPVLVAIALLLATRLHRVQRNPQ